MNRPFVLAITGASGGVYALRLLESLVQSGRDVHLTISRSGAMVLREELGIDIDLDGFRLGRMLDAEGRRVWSDRLPLPRALAAEADRGGGAASSAGPGLGRVRYHHYQDFLAPIASGSFLTAGMVICPCSGGTLSAVAYGLSQNLIHRAADVHLKERRPLILTPRETPLSAVHLENMERAASRGALLLPAMPGWYHGVSSLSDLVDFIVARILDQLGVAHQLIGRWGEGEPDV